MGYRILDVKKVECLECGEPITYGRKDKKFCCEQCKNRFNNRKIRNLRNMKLRIWNTLQKNHDILEGLIKIDVDSINIADIAAMGFNIEYSTSYHKIGKHKEFRCFDIVYFLSETKIFGIRKVAAVISKLGKISTNSVSLHRTDDE